MSLTLRLTLTYLLVTLGGLLLLGVGAVTLAGAYTEQQRERALGSQADLYATYLSEIVASPETLPALAPDLATRATLPTGVQPRIFARNGARLAGDPALGPFPSRAALALISSSLPLPVSQVPGRRYVARSIAGPTGSIGVVELSQSTEDEQVLRHDLLVTVVQAALGAALVMALVSLLVARSIARPIGHLQILAEALANGALDLRANSKLGARRDEIGRLAASLDHMATQLQRRIGESEGERMRLAAVLASISEGVVALDAEGGLLFANPAAERLLDVRDEGQRTEDERPSTDAGEFEYLDSGLSILTQLQALDLPLAPPTVLEREVTLGNRQLLIVVTPTSRVLHVVSEPQHIPASVWVMRDITRLKALEQARTRFVRSISHELRTPLTAIRGALENLHDDARPDQQAPLATLEDEAARLTRLVDELLRPPTDGALLPTERRPVDLGALARELCALQAGRARRAGVTLHCDVVPAIPLVLGDRDRLKQALLNLLDNALRATPPGGEVLVKVEETQARRQSRVRVVVEDSGPGVAAELRERIWQRGVSGRDFGLDDTGGAGLGLALVREIVAAYGGRTWVEGREPNGARFLLELPSASRPG